MFFVKDSPEKVTSSSSSSELFPEDKSSIAETSDDDTSDQNVNSKRNKFTFKKFTKKRKTNTSPSSSPLDWPEEIIISSDEDLEKSMVEMEKQVSLEMSSDSN